MHRLFILLSSLLSVPILFSPAPRNMITVFSFQSNKQVILITHKFICSSNSNQQCSLLWYVPNLKDPGEKAKPIAKVWSIHRSQPPILLIFLRQTCAFFHSRVVCFGPVQRLIGHRGKSAAENSVAIQMLSVKKFLLPCVSCQQLWIQYSLVELSEALLCEY